jgi:hypothetical protein
LHKLRIKQYKNAQNDVPKPEPSDEEKYMTKYFNVMEKNVIRSRVGDNEKNKNTFQMTYKDQRKINWCDLIDDGI